ncbi:E3 ubiquitin-protein ligase TRIM33 [Carassius gibelio]|uniref:E3 ubiquitin-protein ligase TRIM33 n=1 Tax=Carassius gibelio TaxID=101364 RepID=UPI002279998E|nr:E3 ubiquitin-protein ligase TRIM33 [Carassius gibelio]
MFTPHQTGRPASPHPVLQSVYGRCAVCKVHLNSSADPRLLPCLHIVCNSCLTKICTDGATRDCPLCAQSFCLSEVTECAIFEDTSNNNKIPKCAGCEESEVSGWCVQCEEALCLDCTSAHHRVKVTRDHEVTPKKPPTGWIQRRPCPSHTQESLRFFCLVCEELTCKDCQLITHRGHSFVQQEEAVGSQRQQLQSLLDSIKHQKDTVISSLLLLEARLKEIERIKVAAKKMLTQVVHSIYQTLVLKATQMLKLIEAVFAEEVGCLLEKKTSLNRLEGCQEYIAAFIDKILCTEGHCLLVHAKRIETQGKKLLSQKANAPETMIELHLQIQNELCQHIMKFGFLRIRKVHVPFTTQRTDSTQLDSVSGKSSNPNSPITADFHPAPRSSSVDAQVPGEWIFNSSALRPCASSRTVQMNQSLHRVLDPSQPSQPSHSNQAHSACNSVASSQPNQSKRSSSDLHSSSSSPSVQVQSHEVMPQQSKHAYSPSLNPYFPQSASKPHIHYSPSVYSQPLLPLMSCTASQINNNSESAKRGKADCPTMQVSQTHLLIRPLPVNNQTPVTTHPIPVNNQTPVTTHPIPVNNQTLTPTHPIQTNNQIPVPTHTAPINNQTPIQIHPMPSSNQTPILTHQTSANNQTLMPTHPMLANSQTPLQTHQTAVNNQKQPISVNNQTPILTHPVPPNNQMPVLIQPMPANNQSTILTHSLPICNQALILTHPIQTNFMGPGHSFSMQPNIPLTVLSTINTLSLNDATAANGPCAPNPSSTISNTIPSTASGSLLPVNPMSSATISGNDTHQSKSSTYNSINVPVKALADSACDQDADVSSTNFTDTDHLESNLHTSLVSETAPKDPSPDPAHSSGPSNIHQDYLSTITEKCSRQTLDNQPSTKDYSRPKHWSVGMPTTFRQLVETTSIPVTSKDNLNTTPPADSTPCSTSEDLDGERTTHDETVRSAFDYREVKKEDNESSVTLEHFRRQIKQLKRSLRVSLECLPISLPPSGQPLPEFHLTTDASTGHIFVQESQGGQVYQVWRWHKDPLPSRSSSCSVSQDSDSSSASDVEFCAVCLSAGAPLLCAKCGYAFHYDCHIPPILKKPCKDWVCLLCQDVNETVVYGSEEMRTPNLSLEDQRKCEKLLFGLLCEENKSLLFSATKNHSKTAEFDIILGRLLGKRKPPYRTVAELVSDVWTLFDILMMNSERKNMVVKLKQSFQQQLNESFGKSLHASLLNHSSSKDPSRTPETETEQEKHRNTLKRMREFFTANCGTAAKKSCTDKGKEKDGCEDNYSC